MHVDTHNLAGAAAADIFGDYEDLTTTPRHV